MTTGKPVVVKQLPEVLDAERSQVVLQEIAPLFENDHPRLVFDFSGVRQMDSAGVELILRCAEEAIKRNGDLKLAAVCPELIVIFEITRIGHLFEVFDSCNDAVESYQRFVARAAEPKN